MYNPRSQLQLNKMNSNALEKFVIRPAFTGGVAYVLTYAFIGNDGFVPMMSMQLSPASAIGTVAAFGDIAGTLATGQLKNTNQFDGAANAESMVIKPLVTGVCILGVSTLLLGAPGTLAGAGKLAGLGAAASVGGTYVGDAIMPMIPL